MARAERVFQSMSLLSTRDANGYPLKGYDIVPERPKPKPENNRLSELVKLLKEANQRAEYLKQRAHLWQKAYKDLQQEHLALKYDDVCSRCKRLEDETEEGGTVELCHECSLQGETKHDLKQRLEKAHQTIRYWEDCYETLLSEDFKHDRGSDDGSHERV